MTDFSYKEGEIHWKYYSIYLLKLWEKSEKFLIQEYKRRLIVRLSLSNRSNESDKVLLGIKIQFKGKLLEDMKARILIHIRIKY